jgi:MATE family multidrug resistance protein
MEPFSRHLGRTVALGLPLAGSMVTQILVGATDTVMLGWYSVPALAAGTLGSSFFFSVLILGAGFAYAVMPMVAEAEARDDETRARRVTRMGLWLSALFGLLCLPVFVWSGPLMRLMGQGEALAADTQAYLRIAGLGLPFALVVATLRSHLSALDRAQVVLWATVLAALANAALNWVLIFGNLGAPELGIRGAAIASVAVHLTSMVVMLGYSLRGPGMARFDLLRNVHRPDWPILRQIARLGWPIGLTNVAESGLFFASAVMMGWLGTVAVAAHGIALQIAAVVFMVHVGLSQAATVRVGRFWGRGDGGNLRLAAGAAATLSGIAVVAATGLYLGAGEAVVRLMVDPTDPQAPLILPLAVQLLVFAALFQLVDAGQVMALGCLRGVQDTRRPMFYAIVAYWALGLPASYVLGFPLGLGPAGIWLGLVVGLAVAAVTLTARFVRLAGALPSHREGDAAAAGG